MSDYCYDERTKMAHSIHAIRNILTLFASYSDEIEIWIQVDAFDDNIEKIIPLQKNVEREKIKPKLREPEKKSLNNDKLKIKLLKDNIKLIKSNLKIDKKEKLNKKNENYKFEINTKTLWIIIIIMSIIILIFTIKTLNDYKIIRFISK
jgi:hypothetical protein